MVATTKNQTTASAGAYDWGLLSVVMLLFGLGMVMVLSASFAWGYADYQDPYFYVTRQLIWGAFGLVVMVVMANIPYTIWERWSVVLMAIALLALMAVIAIGSERFNATRTFLGGSVQPSEPAKIIIVMYVSAWLASKGERIRDVRVGLLPFSVLMGAIAVLIVAQPNISTAILIVTTASIMFFIAGAEMRQLLVVGAGGAATFWLVIRYSTYAHDRVAKYMASLWDPMQSDEYQVQRAVEALIRGGLFGQGIGNSQAKLPGYLPVVWSDNIFAVVGEEMGLLGALLVIFLFALLAYFGLRTALRAPDNFGMLLATGITASLTLQAILNMAVIVAAAPPTGVTLPFISYGGSSLVTALAAIGILLNISRHGGLPVANRSGTGNSSPAPQTTRLAATASRRRVASVTRGTETRGTETRGTGKESYARFDFGWRHWWTRLSGAGRRRSVAESRKPVRSSRRAGERPTSQRTPTRR
jgi:cell division protein FtsW